MSLQLKAWGRLQRFNVMSDNCNLIKHGRLLFAQISCPVTILLLLEPFHHLVFLTSSGQVFLFRYNIFLFFNQGFLYRFYAVLQIHYTFFIPYQLCNCDTFCLQSFRFVTEVCKGRFFTGEFLSNFFTNSLPKFKALLRARIILANREVCCIRNLYVNESSENMVYISSN